MFRKAVKRSLPQIQEPSQKKNAFEVELEKPKKETILTVEEEKLLEVVVLGNTDTHEEILNEEDAPKTKPIEPAWQDDDDDLGFVEYTTAESWVNHKNPTLNQAVNQKLRENKFKEVIGITPEWAEIPNEDEKNEADDSLVSGSYVYTQASEMLPKNILEYSQLKDANFDNKEGDLMVCEFHKTAQIAMMVSSLYRLSLYQVDGKLNPKLHSLYLENFPVRSGHFLQNGEEILLTSSRKSHLYDYNIVTGKLSTIKKPLGFNKTEQPNSFKVARNGKQITILSSSGNLHLMSPTSKEIVGNFRGNERAIDFDFLEDGDKMISLSDGGRFHLWDVRMQSCYHSFTDESLFGPTNLATSPDSKYIACGSQSGIVSLYDETCFHSENCSPLKEFKNLRTTITSLCFNPTSEILAMGSEAMKNSIKLVHIKSLTAFSNFPVNSQKIKRKIRMIDFSTNSGFMLNGAANGRALLYKLNHYKGY